MLKRYPVLLLIFFSGSLFSQIDSLKKYAISCSKDTAKAAAYIKIARAYYNTEGILDSSMAYYNKAAFIYKAAGIPTKLARALNGKALIYREKGMYKDALDFSLQALSISEKEKEWKGDIEQIDDICVLGIKI